MDRLELTREDIVNNEQITISDISNPLTVDDGDYFHVYIGISATSLCEVDLEITDGFIGGYGSISLERLTRQTNMYALHFSLDSYLYDYQKPQYRNSEFFITAYTCGELSEEAELTINQKGCEHTCTITWKNENTILETDTAQVGASPSYDGPTPTKQNPQPGYTYEFAGWSPVPSKITGDTVYQAQFTAIPITFTVTWKMDDGSVLTTQTYNLGAMPVYPGETPSKPSDAQYNYTFSAWTPNIVPVTADTIYTAQFSATTREYIVTWLMDNGTTVIDRTSVAYGTHATHADVTKASDMQYDYEFAGWTPNPEIELITGNTAFTAQFTAIPIDYNVYWKDSDGNTLQSNEDVHYGDRIAYTGETPSKEQTYRYTYEFNGWAPNDGSGTPYTISVTGNTTYVAQFVQHDREFTVSFNMGGYGTQVPPQSVPYSSYAERPNDPVDSDDEYRFHDWYTEPGFSTIWDFDEDGVYHDMTLYAKWDYTCVLLIYEMNVEGSTPSGQKNLSYGDDVYFISDETGDEYTEPYLGVITCDKCITKLGNHSFYTSFRKDAEDVIGITLPSHLTVLEDSESNEGIFDDSGLRKADLRNVTKIGAWTFEGCEFYALLPDTSSEIEYYNNLGGCAVVSTELVEIGEQAFGGNKLRKVELPNSVTSLNATFRYCNALTAVTLPNSITAITNGTFEECNRLTSIELPNSLEIIGEDCFSECTGLTSISIPSGVTEIGDWAFYACSGLTSISIPSGVTIGKHAFKHCSGLTSVTISAVSIGDGAFECCHNLESVIISTGVTSIGHHAFSGCTKLTSIVIPSSVKTIGNYAFEGCAALTSVFVSGEITNFGNDVFAGCTGLSITNNIRYAGYCAVEALNNLSSYSFKSGTRFIDCGFGTNLASITLPTSTKTIGPFAFAECTGLTSISIPSNVISIGEYAFRNCTGLTSISIPNSVKNIDDNAFSGCKALTAVTIGTGLTNIGDSAFRGCSKLTTISIPNSVKTIKSSAFYGCTALTAVTIGTGVTSIAEDAFENCTSLPTEGNIRYAGAYLVSATTRSLSAYTIKSGTKWIGKSAFSGCTNMTSISIPSTVTMIGSEAFKGCNRLTAVTIPNGVKNIANYTFEGCSNLQSATIPNSVTNIGIQAFSGCTRLASITIPNSVISIGNNAFNRCESLETLNIPDSVAIINDAAFYNCTGLTAVTIGTGITAIGFSCFNGCTNLSQLTIYGRANISSHVVDRCDRLSAVTINGYGIKYNWRSSQFGNTVKEFTLIGNDNIEACALSGNTNITAVTISGGINTIEPEAFKNCTNLEVVTLSNNVKYINNNAFEGCTSLTSITIPNTVEYIGNETFSGCTNLETVSIGNKITRIGNYDFYSCSSITAITIGTKVKSIGKFAFFRCGDLDSITIPDNVETIESYAFSQCGDLETVSIGNGVTSIGNYAFYNCTGLTAVTIGTGVTSIGKGAFDECHNIEDISIPSGVTVIDNYAFSRCYSLTGITCNATTPPDIYDGTWNEVDKSNATLYVPEGSVDLYAQHELWGEFENISAIS